MQLTTLVFNQLRPGAGRLTFDPNGIDRTDRLAKTAAVTAVRERIAVVIPALSWADIAAASAACLLIIIIQATVFSDCKISHKGIFAVGRAMSCQKNTVSSVWAQGFF